MKRSQLIIREIKNYLYLRKVLKRESRSNDPNSTWNSLKLRKNWFGRIYTVISLREEDMGEEEVVRNWKAMEKMRPINDYLSTLDLQEILFPSIENIPESRSYLVVYSPLFKELTFSWVLWRLFAVIATISAATITLINVL
jgi:hypothetical protein